MEHVWKASVRLVLPWEKTDVASTKPSLVQNLTSGSCSKIIEKCSIMQNGSEVRMLLSSLMDRSLNTLEVRTSETWKSLPLEIEEFYAGKAVVQNNVIG